MRARDARRVSGARARGAAALLLAAAGGLSLTLAPGLVPGARAAGAAEAGRQVYDKHCAQCHGEKGDGLGPAAPHLLPRPRDFTTGKFKLRTTPSGQLPTDEDLRRVVRLGMPYTSMPPWPILSDAEVDAVVQYLKTFHDGFTDPAQAPKPISLPRAPASSKESIEKGKTLYVELGCVRCHGEAGRGEGPSAPTLVDDLGHPIKAADLTRRWTFRGGPTREDVFRTFSTGVNGTPMPSFVDSVSEADRWALTDYVYSLGDGDLPRYATLVVARPLEDEIDEAKGAALFEGSAQARFPVVGQIMEPGRAFAPSANAVEVRAVYDAQRIAFEVRWHDIRSDTQNSNSPTLEVPLAEEELAVKAAEPAAGETDVWGEPTGAAAPAPAEGGGDFWGEGAPADAGAAGPAAEFSDAVALQWPATQPEGVVKPYFLFGDAQKPVDLWFLDLAAQRVRQFVGRGSGAGLTPQEGAEVTGKGSYEAGAWTAVFVRPLRSASGASFAEGQYLPVAFSIWDGTARERGNRRGITQWFYVYLPPREKPSVLAPMAKAAGGVLLVEMLVVALLRRKRS